MTVLRDQAAGLADRAVGRDADERRDSGAPRSASPDRVRGCHEVEVGDDRPEAGAPVILVRVLEDEDRVTPWVAIILATTRSGVSGGSR